MAVALGNSGAKAAVPALVKALDDEEPLIRGHVAWALGQLGGVNAREALERRQAIEEDAEVKAELAEALDLL